MADATLTRRPLQGRSCHCTKNAVAISEIRRSDLRLCSAAPSGPNPPPPQHWPGPGQTVVETLPLPHCRSRATTAAVPRRCSLLVPRDFPSGERTGPVLAGFLADSFRTAAGVRQPLLPNPESRATLTGATVAPAGYRVGLRVRRFGRIAHLPVRRSRLRLGAIRWRDEIIGAKVRMPRGASGELPSTRFDPPDPDQVSAYPAER
jgi:hypothetical protein